MVEMDEKTLESGWVRWRQDFHRFPETGFNERGTSERVAQVLQMLGLEVTGASEEPALSRRSRWAPARA